jgi:hypothetical protein
VAQLELLIATKDQRVYPLSRESEEILTHSLNRSLDVITGTQIFISI